MLFCFHLWVREAWGFEPKILHTSHRRRRFFWGLGDKVDSRGALLRGATRRDGKGPACAEVATVLWSRGHRHTPRTGPCGVYLGVGHGRWWPWSKWDWYPTLPRRGTASAADSLLKRRKKTKKTHDFTPGKRQLGLGNTVIEIRPAWEGCRAAKKRGLPVVIMGNAPTARKGSEMESGRSRLRARRITCSVTASRVSQTTYCNSLRNLWIVAHRRFI